VPTTSAVLKSELFHMGCLDLVSGPTSNVTIDDINDPETMVTINDIKCCPYVSINSNDRIQRFGTPFQGCQGFDLVDIYIYEEPDVSAGNDL